MFVLSENFWNALGAIGENIGALLGGIALIYSISIYRASMMFHHYGELDKGYFDLLNMAVERPFLRAPDSLSTDEQKQSYDIYAFMVWNFLETILDRLKDHAGLAETWLPVLEAEVTLHRAWFERPENRARFKASFWSQIQKMYPPKPPAGGSAATA